MNANLPLKFQAIINSINQSCSVFTSELDLDETKNVVCYTSRTKNEAEFICFHFSDLGIFYKYFKSRENPNILLQISSRKIRVALLSLMIREQESFDHSFIERIIDDYPELITEIHKQNPDQLSEVIKIRVLKFLGSNEYSGISEIGNFLTEYDQDIILHRINRRRNQDVRKLNSQ